VLKKLRELLFGPTPEDPEYWVRRDFAGSTTLHNYARYPDAVIPDWALTEENLGLRDALGVTVMAAMISNDKIAQVPKESMTRALFNEPYTELQTVLDHAVRLGKAGQLPAELFLQPDATLTDMGYEVLSKAAKFGWDHAPSDLITSRYLNEEIPGKPTCFRQAAMYGNIHNLPLHILTNENFSKTDAAGATVFHEMIGLGWIKELPPECINLPNLLLRNIRGTTAFQSLVMFGELDQLPNGYVARNFEKILSGAPNMLHELAATGYLNRLPEGLLKLDDYRRVDEHGSTVLHTLAQHSCLDRAPKELLTDENMRLSNKWYTVYHEAASAGCLNQIPRELLTPEVLSLLDTPPNAEGGHSVLAWAIGAQSKDDGYDEFLGSLLTVENIAEVDVSWGRNVMQLAADNGYLHRIPTSLLVPDSYKRDLDKPLRGGKTWWEAHLEHIRCINSLVEVDERPEMDLF